MEQAAVQVGSGASWHAGTAVLGQPWDPGTPKSAPSMCRHGVTHGHDAAGLPGTKGALYQPRAGLGSGTGMRLAQAEHVP